ncbi:MAG: SpoIIE family protein phosphatase [Bryobacterales bacterium]|nr:SpoIIE family protein phosphatase [Bryobacterales bacterium]
MPELLITEADGATRVIPLDAAPLLMGRDPNCEIPFPTDPELSRRHLIIEPDAGHWWVRDLGSTNGTRLNGALLSAKHLLKFGDTIGASKISILFRDRQTQTPALSRTVVFDAGKFESISSGTISVHLHEVLESQEVRPKGFTPGATKQWASPLQALIRVGRELAQRRPLDELFPVILDLALESVNAERGVLMVLENDDLTLGASRGGEFRISTAVRDKVLTERASLLVESIADAPALKERKSIIIQGVRSLMCVPLQTDERVIGLLYVDALNYLRRFTNDDLSLLTVMANVAAMRIERERLAEIEQMQRLQQAELDQAAEIQIRHLPSHAPVWPELEIAARHLPCRTVGGDYHDYLQLADGRYLVLCGDVAGKGLPAALMMMNVHARVQALAESCTSVADFMVRLNRGMNPTCPPNRFVTLFACAFHPSTGALTYTNAGHNPALLIRAGGAIESLRTGGMFVALIPGLTYEEATVTMQPGDTLILYSDGITEEENSAGEEFGSDRLAEIASHRRTWPAHQLADSIFDELSTFSEARQPTDDRTLVILRRR